MDRDNTDTRVNRDDNNNEAREEPALEKYSHDDFDNLVQQGGNHPIIEFNGNFPQETGIKPSSHDNSDNLLQEEEPHETIETRDSSPQETAFETYSHKDFDELVEEEKTHQIIETNNDDPHESAIETYSHEAFDNLVQEEENHQIVENDKLIREGETSGNNINARVESAFESYSHQNFDNLIREEETFESYTHQDQADANPIGEGENFNNNSYGSNEDVDKKFREEITAHHTNIGSRNPTDTNSQDRFREEVTAHHTKTASRIPTGIRSQDPAPIVTVSPLQSSTENPVSVVTAPPLPRNGNSDISNIFQNPHPNNQITIAYLAFFLIVTAVVAYFMVICMGRRRRSNRQKLEVYQYLGGFDIEDIDVRRSITGGWHGQYRNNLAKGLDEYSDFETYIDSDDGSRCSDSGTNEKTIVFLEQGDLSSPMRSPGRALPFTMLVADRNIYLDDPSEDVDSDDEDIFSPVRTRPF